MPGASVKTLLEIGQARSLPHVLFAIGLVISPCDSLQAADRPDAAEVEFFEKKIRPVLSENCFKCHSAQAQKAGKLKGGLLLDERAGFLKGGDTGPAVVPGKAASSLLMKAVLYTDESLRMPPTARLPNTVIADIQRWIDRGANFPPTQPTSAAIAQSLAEARRHWAFQPIRSVAPPSVRDEGWPLTPVDRFIVAKMEARGLSPSPPADHRTLLRRVYYDLIGLPPSPEELAAFLADDTPNAYERVVDRLLASPHYGERWGRHWLDVARYADTKDGVLMYGDDRIHPYAYTYRDYVVRAFNEDLPFERFIHEQLAADLIEPAVEPWRLAAMGFLTLGRMFDNNIHDIIDDRIDTVSRGLMGLTVSCARCHDHKYDPLPMADYYSLYGVFAGCEQPLELPLTERPENLRGQEAFEKEIAPKRRAVQQMLDEQFRIQSEAARQRVADYLVHVATTQPDPLETAVYFLSLAPEDLRPPIVARWRNYLQRRARPDDPVFGPWQELFALDDKNFTAQARAVVERWRARPAGTDKGQVNPLLLDALVDAELRSKADVARAYGELLQRVYNESKARSSCDPAWQQLLEIVAGRESPSYFPKSNTRHYMSRKEKDAFGGKVQELDRIALKHPQAPPRAMVLNDAPEPYEPQVFLRGNPSRPGAKVPKQFLWILEGDERTPFRQGSGRLQLAHAIAARDNPLTSRVIVNRVWMHHFGEPLVDTPSDFGTRSTPPSHPQLLDYLAARLQDERWSLKSLHRLIVLSSTYRQASFDRPKCREVDPDNRLLWRMRRRRLEVESMRDSLLFISGRLEQRLGGRPLENVIAPHNRRRTVYSLVDRQSLPGLFRAFDFASPDQSAERRPQTTVPQQALFGMNAPFVLEQARALANRPEIASVHEPEKRVVAMYQRVLLRPPDGEELRLALEFIAAARNQDGSKLGPWEQLAQVLLLTNEGMFVE